MRKKAIPRKEQQNEWYVASLTPAASALFSESFYPDSSNGEMKVFVSVCPTVNQNPDTTRVRIMNGFNPKTIRLMNGQIANRCLDIQRAVNNTEFNKINEAIISAQ